MDFKDTIVALATPAGVGAIGVIRLSGDRAIEIVNDVFQPKDLSIQTSHTLHYGRIESAGRVLSLIPRSIGDTTRWATMIFCMASPLKNWYWLWASLN